MADASHRLHEAPARFLFVDDNAFLARAIERVAEACGFAVCVTMTAVEFRERYRDWAPNLLGFDLAMPGGDGIELMRFLAEEGCREPILIVSGYDRRVLAAAARLGRERGLNIAATLNKPFSIETLRAALECMREGLIAGRSQP